MKAIINIGLNNNPYTANEIIERISKDFKIIEQRLATGTYDGEVEPTLVLSIDNPYAYTSGFIKKIESLADVLTQSCIAVSTEQFDLLCYAQGYKGTRSKFNKKYFIS